MGDFSRATLNTAALVFIAVTISGCAFGVPLGSAAIAVVSVVVLLVFAACGSSTRYDETPDAGGDAGEDPELCGEGECLDYMTCWENLSGAAWCYPDADRDGLRDAADNCPFAPNIEQVDSDGDGLGDACDLCDGPNTLVDCDDPDGDGIQGVNVHPLFDEEADNCPYLDNPDQLDSDGDWIGDLCDLEPFTPNEVLSPCGTPFVDSDGDGISDSGDCAAGYNDDCQFTPSAHSGDDDADGVGDVCDPDGLEPEPIVHLDRDALRRELLQNLADEGVLDRETAELALG